MQEEIIIKLLKNNLDKGLSITDLVTLSKIPRSIVRIILARLEGGKKVYVRQVGMAKLYYLNEKRGI
jgi:DNA-binding IclR family transcriptional regulator